MKRFLHQYIWQRLPRDFRRAALFHATALTAPRPEPDARSSAPILVAGTMQSASGLGQSARLCHDALKIIGLPVLGVDITKGMMQPVEHAHVAYIDGRDDEGPGTIILHINSPLLPLAMTQLGQRLIRNKYVIGYWAWELPKVPAEWRLGLPFVHEIWVPSSYTAEAVRPLAGRRPVRIMPHPVALNMPETRVPAMSAGSTFTVLSMFDATSSLARKNPFAAIAAFKRAFGGDPSARLIVKASHLSTVPPALKMLQEHIGSAPNITLLAGVLNPAEMERLYSEVNVVMSLHRSEGFGLIIAEAMMRGLPVIATNWSGNVDFMDRGNSLPIPYQLIPANDPQGTYHYPEMLWAEADVQSAAEALRGLRQDPDLALRLGQAAASFAKREWSAQNYWARVSAHLNL